MTSLKGQFLVATPELLAPIFTQSVILMLDHTAEGAAGVVLNRLTESTINSVAPEVFGEESDWEKWISLGGPVPGPLIVLHTLEELADETILPGVYSTVDAEKVLELVRRKVEPSLTIANYSGWTGGQLEGEMGEGSWVVVPATLELVFWEGLGVGGIELWRVLTKKYEGSRWANLLGIKSRELPPDPRLN